MAARLEGMERQGGLESAKVPQENARSMANIVRDNDEEAVREKAGEMEVDKLGETTGKTEGEKGLQKEMVGEIGQVEGTGSERGRQGDDSNIVGPDDAPDLRQERLQEERGEDGHQGNKVSL